jgi:hypothetical protein
VFHSPSFHEYAVIRGIIFPAGAGKPIVVFKNAIIGVTVYGGGPNNWSFTSVFAFKSNISNIRLK